MALLKLANSPDPFQPVAAAAADLLGDLSLRLEHRAAEVAAAHENLTGM